MEFKSRFVRGLPVLALAASLLVPFKPLAAAEGPYTAARPDVSAVPAAQITAADPAAADELDAAVKARKPRRDKKLRTIAAADPAAARDALDGKKDHRRKPRNA